MDVFNVGGGGLPVMEVDGDASGEGLLVFVRRPRRALGAAVGGLGAVVLAASGALAAVSEHAGAMLALGSFAAAALGCVGVIVATSRHRLVVGRTTGSLISSWWFLGIENRTSKGIGEPRAVDWTREVWQDEGGTSGVQERITFPVLLHSTVDGRRPVAGAAAVRRVGRGGRASVGPATGRVPRGRGRRRGVRAATVEAGSKWPDGSGRMSGVPEPLRSCRDRR